MAVDSEDPDPHVCRSHPRFGYFFPLFRIQDLRCVAQDYYTVRVAPSATWQLIARRTINGHGSFLNQAEDWAPVD